MAAEKLNFAQTCNLLSQFLKEKRTLQVIPPTTMNLLTTMEAAASNSVDQTAQTPSSKPSIDLLPQFTKYPEAALGDQQPGSAAQMTIFYGGQVLVFNDLQAEKAKEIMGLATTGSSKISAGFVKKLGSENQSNVVAENKSQEIKVPTQARRASLHKFLAKRKERVTAVAPYQLNNQRASSPAKSDEQTSSRAEGQSSKQLELSL
ncbi:hypothetical protein ACFX13_047111 [Malus domestica]|uniref:jasmonate ZIM domain-containing protein 1-like n=1 Tax=Malus domestica TaxID=3750 RepID=UPI000498FEC8|nr:protein TIFY 6b-like [Malus domestica]